MEFDLTKIVGILLVVSAAILAAIVIVSFFALRSYIRKTMLNKNEDQ